jgi:hypothetical protein
MMKDLTSANNPFGCIDSIEETGKGGCEFTGRIKDSMSGKFRYGFG